MTRPYFYRYTSTTTRSNVVGCAVHWNSGIDANAQMPNAYGFIVCIEREVLQDRAKAALSRAGSLIVCLDMQVHLSLVSTLLGGVH